MQILICICVLLKSMIHNKRTLWTKDELQPIDVTYPAKLVLLQDMILASCETIEFEDSGDEPW